MTTTAATLAGLIRNWRDRLAPADVGLGATGRRRATGLRREEFAALAGVSVDYVVRLEQGRAMHPSVQVVAALARALQLSNAERDLLYEAAGLLPPRPSHLSWHIPPSVQRLTVRLGGQPVAVFAADWTLLSWSPLWAALLGDPAGLHRRDRNLLRIAFLDPTVYPLPDEDEGALHADLVADLHASAARYPDDPRLAQLIEGLSAGSALFRQLWAARPVARHTSATKTIHHPVVGDLALDCDVLTAPGADLRIVVYSTAHRSPAAEKLDFLRVTAIRQLEAVADATAR